MGSVAGFLTRGLLAGLFAGLVAFGIAYVVGEPSVSSAIAIEESSGATHDHGAKPDGTSQDHDHAAGAPVEDQGHDTQVPRSIQSTLGLGTGTLVAGTVLGGLFGVLSAFAMGRFGGLSARASTVGVVGIGFVAISLVPSIGYPPNPPAVGEPDTIAIRTATYFVLVAISIIAAVVAVLVGRRLAHTWGSWYAALAAIAGFIVVITISVVLLPSFNEVPVDFPADVLFDFRRSTLTTQIALWGTLAVVLAELIHRHTKSARQTGPAVVSEPLPTASA